MNTGRFPVENVSWEEAQTFCEKLSDRAAEQSLARRYRLPTEAEWEYACRAGTTTPYHFGPTLSKDLANDGYMLRRPTRVGSYPANPWGLFDMHGNVAEWCEDWYDDAYYTLSPEPDPPGPSATGRRVVRGGSFLGPAWDCRSAARAALPPKTRAPHVGFRVVMVVG
jgi:formylglycine-generating enzyme required for sulfatase activity